MRMSAGGLNVRSKSMATACMLRDEYLEGRIYGWLEASIIWRFYKNGRDSMKPVFKDNVELPNGVA